MDMMTKESVLRIYSDFFNLFEGFKILRTAQILLNIPDNKLGFEQRLKLINEANPDLDVDFLTKLNLIDKKSDSGDAQYVKGIL